MLFNSFSFLIFFPLVTAAYFLLAHRWRWSLLLAASCLFYMWFIPKYILILFVLIVIDYWAALLIEREDRGRKRFLIISILATCAALVFFKYFNFFNGNMAALAHVLGLKYPDKILNLILPIGLSFHTFQSLSYVIEVYRGRQRAERHFGVYALYVMFYPQLVAGPIERPQNLLHQFHEEHAFDYHRVTDGLKLMAWGMFKKVVIADRLSLVVAQVYGAPQAYQGPALVIATIFFAFQIYCDFSGYSDIAIGSAQVMGFRLMDNFNRPYFAKSVSEFWKRWHISLSSWFRDYIYIPLGGSRCSRWRWQFNLFLTFLLSGLWHGANWTFIIWGALNGLFLIAAIWTDRVRRHLRRALGIEQRPRIKAVVQVMVTFTLICFAWIFFRARDTADAWLIVSRLFTGWGELVSVVAQRGIIQGVRLATGLPPGQLVLSVFVIGVLLLVHALQRHGSIRRMLSERSLWVRWMFYYSLVLGIFVLGVFTGSQFIYFQF